MTTKPAKATKRRRPSQAQVNRVFVGSRIPRNGSCRVEWGGPMPANGPLMMGEGRNRKERQRAAYGLAFGRLKRTDRVVAVCGNPRCLDRRHLHVVPAPVQPKLPNADTPDTAATP